MSIHVISQIMKINFGGTSRKVVALKLADNANEDGSSIKPSLDTIARDSEASRSTVRRILNEWLKLGLLVMVRKGGRGPKSTNEYAFDMELIRLLFEHANLVRKLSYEGLKTRSVSVSDFDDKGIMMNTLNREKGVMMDTLKGVTMNTLKPVRCSNEGVKGVTVTPNPSYKPVRECSHTPNAREGEVKKFPVSELENSDASPKVVEHFIVPLTASLRLDPNQHDLEFFKRLCRQLERFSEKVLAAGADVLEVARTVFPSIKLCVEACSEAQAKLMVRIHYKSDPAAWEAWKDYFRRNGPRWRFSRMESLEDEHIRVYTKFPPAEASKNGEAAA